jgi:hypothetical protein
MRQWLNTRSFWQYALARGALFWIGVSVGGSAGGFAAGIISHQALQPHLEIVAVLLPVCLTYGIGEAKRRERNAFAGELVSRAGAGADQDLSLNDSTGPAPASRWPVKDLVEESMALLAGVLTGPRADRGDQDW